MHGENTIAIICRVSESATSALKALIEGHASEQHEDFDKCSVATWQRAHLKFENCRIGAADPQEVAKYSLHPGAQVDVVLL